MNKRREDEELDTELTRVDIIKCVQSEKVRFRGVNLSGLDLSKLVRSPVDLSIEHELNYVIVMNLWYCLVCTIYLASLRLSF